MDKVQQQYHNFQNMALVINHVEQLNDKLNHEQLKFCLNTD